MRRGWQAAARAQTGDVSMRVSWLVAASMTPSEWSADPMAARTARALGSEHTSTIRALLCLHTADPRSLVGADERNALLARLPPSPSTWVYFLDADTLLHPRFFARVPSVLAAAPSARMVFFAQIRKARRSEDAIVTFHRPSGPASVAIGQVDTGTQLIRSDLLGDARFVFGRRDCDGELIVRLHRKLLAATTSGGGGGGGGGGEVVFLNEELALYNWLKCVDVATPLLRYAGIVRAEVDAVSRLQLTLGDQGTVIASVGRGHHRECPRPVGQRIALGAPLFSPWRDGGTPALRDLESPGALHAAAAAHASVDGQLILLASGPDETSLAMLRNVLAMLARLQLHRRVLLLTDCVQTCEALADLRAAFHRCYWSSRLVHNRPSDSGSMTRAGGVGWDWRHRFYEAKKHYIYQLAALGYGVLQADTDVVWARNPFPALRAMAAANASVVVQADNPIANAGLMYASAAASVPSGTRRGVSMLAELAWRIKLFQRRPDVVGQLVGFARPPYYSNPDDQTLLNDCILSFALRNRTFLGSTARYEARNRHNGYRGPDWDSLPEAQAHADQLARVRALSEWRRVRARKGERAVGYSAIPIGGGEVVAVAPGALFGMVSHDANSWQALTHLSAVRGFEAKRAYLQRHGLWYL